MFNSFFGNQEKKDFSSNVEWLNLTSLDQLNEIRKQSESTTVLVFKHSTRCGISSMVIKRFEGLFNESHKNLKVYCLDLLNYRDVSNEIAKEFCVIHQSPQLLVIKNGSVVHHASHYDITEINLEKFN